MIEKVTRFRVYEGIRVGDWYFVEYSSGVTRDFRVQSAPKTVHLFIGTAKAEIKDRSGYYIVYKMPNHRRGG